MAKTDFKVIEQVISRRGEPERIPFYEHFVDYEVMAEIMGWHEPAANITERERWKNAVDFYLQMGYDYIPVELPPNFVSRHNLSSEDTALYSRGNRDWVDEHFGPIQTRKDLEEALWPLPEEAFDYKMFDIIAGFLPDGIKIIGGASGGPFEHASFLMGFENLALAVHTDPEFVDELFRRIGETLVAVAERLATRPALGIYRFGDDLGFKTATMLSPAHLERYVFPWQKKVVEAVHKVNKPFILHSCGQLSGVMDRIIDYVKIDAKHSFEDVIMPVEQFKERWGTRVAVLGGVDVGLLTKGTPQEVKSRTEEILKKCTPGGGYALGSGNTIANYIPVNNYLAMLKAGREFNGVKE